jgi:hypothetical protein
MTLMDKVYYMLPLRGRKVSMAQVNGLMSLEVLDYLGVTTSFDLPITVTDTTTLATLATTAKAFQVVADAVTGGQITRCQVKLDTGLDVTLKSSPITGDENEKTALFNYSQTGSPYKYGIDIPAVRETLIVSGKINLSDAAVEAFDAWVKIAHSNIQAVSKYGLLLIAMVDALISFRKHRKAETRRSIEVG